MKKIKFYLQMTLALILFFVLYDIIEPPLGKYVVIFFLFPLALFFAQTYKHSIFIFIFISIEVAVFTFGFFNFLTLNITIIFLSLIPILFYFFKPDFPEMPDVKKNNSELKFFREELINEQKAIISKRNILEKKSEKIMQFYLILKDLNKYVTAEESANALSNVLASKPGISYVVVAAKNKKTLFTTISFLDSKLKDKWDNLLTNNEEIKNLTEPGIIYSLIPIDNKTVIGWPVRIQNKLISCILLVVEKNYVQTYLEAGYFYLPHLILGTKRILLFAELKEKARVDGLTGLYRRQYFMDRLYIEIQRAKRYKTDFYILMADIDFFKTVNDTYGHPVGDKVLTSIAKIFNKTIRPGDLVGRYGGEEFIILFPMLTEQKVFEIAENIRKSIKRIKFNENNLTFSVTISIGIAKYKNNLDSENLIAAADKALYEAKLTGRNKTVIYKDSDTSVSEF